MEPCYDRPTSFSFAQKFPRKPSSRKFGGGKKRGFYQLEDCERPIAPHLLTDPRIQLNMVVILILRRPGAQMFQLFLVNGKPFDSCVHTRRKEKLLLDYNVQLPIKCTGSFQ